MNPNARQLTEPYQRTMTFLSFIRGPNTDDWVAEKADWLINQVAGGVLPTEENLWHTVINRFSNMYTDTAIKSRSQRQLRELQMKQENLDNYIAEFHSLANKAGYTLDEEATLNVFQNRLPDQLVVNIIKFHHPITWDEWTAASRLQHQEYIFLKDRTRKGEKHFRGTKGQWQKAFSCPKDPNAMDIGRTRARATLTEEDKQKLQAEGRCFRCQKQGHILRTCPQRPPAHAAEASTSTIATASSTAPPTLALTDEQKADTIITMLGTQSQRVQDVMANKMFKEEEDFSEA